MNFDRRRRCRSVTERVRPRLEVEREATSLHFELGKDQLVSVSVASSLALPRRRQTTRNYTPYVARINDANARPALSLLRREFSGRGLLANIPPCRMRARSARLPTSYELCYRAQRMQLTIIINFAKPPFRERERAELLRNYTASSRYSCLFWG